MSRAYEIVAVAEQLTDQADGGSNGDALQFLFAVDDADARHLLAVAQKVIDDRILRGEDSVMSALLCGVELGVAAERTRRAAS